MLLAGGKRGSEIHRSYLNTLFLHQSHGKLAVQAAGE
jgi:hypothetical protein